MQLSGMYSAFRGLFPNHTFPRVCVLAFLFPLVVLPSLHSLSVLLIVFHVRVE